MGRSGSGHPTVTAALAMMAVRRQAGDVDAETFDLYASDLADESIPVDHVVEACRQIGREPRAEGDTSFPSLGVLLERCRKVGRQECYRIAQAQQKMLPPAPISPPLTTDEAKKFLADLHKRVAAKRRR